MHFLHCPQHTKHSDLDNVWMTHAKIDQNKFTFPQILHLSSNRRVRNLTFYFQFTTPARKLTHRMKFEHVWMHKDTNFGNTIILCYLRPEKCQNPTQKDTNFGSTTILPHLRPEKHQETDPERHEFQQRHNSSLPWARELPNPTVKDTNFAQKLHSLTPAKMPRKVFIFPEFRTSFEMHSLTPSTLTKQQLGNT